jgi:hypothetical protein
MALKKTQSCKHIFVYGKTKDLITYIELRDEKLNSFYHLKNRLLTKYNVFSFLERRRPVQEVNRAVIQFEEDCTLHHRFLDKESRVIAIKPSSLIQAPAKSGPKVYLSNEHNLEGCTLHPSLIETWLKMV